MSNKQALKQERYAIKHKIKESPFVLNLFTYPLIENVYKPGTFIPDPSGVPTSTQYTVRISHERIGPVPNEDKPSGLSTNLTRFILADHLTPIKEGDTIDNFNGRQYTIGPVDPLIKFGGTIGFQAPLQEGNYV